MNWSLVMMWEVMGNVAEVGYPTGYCVAARKSGYDALYAKSTGDQAEASGLPPNPESRLVGAPPVGRVPEKGDIT